MALTLGGCASTSSVVMHQTLGGPKVAILPLEGPLGAQAVDFLSSELGDKGIAVVERAKLIPLIAVDTDLSPTSPAAVQSFARYGEALDVRYLFAGTVSAVPGPLYSYPHVNMTLRLIDVRSGQTVWLGRYGNPLWSSAISTQGDVQRGARDLVAEFVKVGGLALLAK